MRLPKGSLYFITILWTLGNISHANIRWAQEATGELPSVLGTSNSNSNGEQNEQQWKTDRYKNNLLQYVFQTQEPTQATLDSNTDVPYVMNKLYEMLADRTSGRVKKTAPFDVDYIRGLEDQVATENRMQFWFDTSIFNNTEDVIEAYFHIYKRRAIGPRPTGSTTPHHITVRIFKIIDPDSVFNTNGTVNEVSGAELLQRQQISAYSSEWVVFKQRLKETVREWIRHPDKNKGFLITATDPNDNHVNGTHIDFVQRGENPKRRQPLFVVYTDKDRKKTNKMRRTHRTEIDHVVLNFLNEDTRRLQTICRATGGTEGESIEECTQREFRHRRSLMGRPVEDDEEDDYNDSWEDDSGRSKRGGRRRNPSDLRNTEYCRRKDLYVTFAALNWQGWIVAPEGVNADYCDGKCPFPLTSSLTASNHAVLQSVSNYYFPDVVKPPCCVPRTLDKMSILYLQDERTVTMRQYDGMIVNRCGCR